jgi:hypothetical protein
VSSSSPISPVVGHLSDLALWEAELAVDSVCGDSVAGDPLSVASPLLDRLRQIPDPRRLRGLCHPLLVILVLTACATLVVGNDSVTAIRQWAARTPQDVLHRLGARYNPGRVAVYVTLMSTRDPLLRRFFGGNSLHIGIPRRFVAGDYFWEFLGLSGHGYT